MRKNDYIYIFLHIPKTGGTTIRKHIMKNISESERLFLSYPDLRFNPYKLSYKKLFKTIKKDIGKLSKYEKKKIKIIFGEEVPYGVHKLFPDRSSRYFTFLRDPEKRAISLYNFYRTRYEKDKKVGVHRAHYDHQLLINGRVPSFKRWLEEKYSVRENSTESIIQLLKTMGFLKDRRVTKTSIDKALDKFYFIGLTEKSREDFSYIYSILDFNKYFIRQNVSKKFVLNESEEEKRILRNKTQLARLLYKEAILRNKIFKLNKDNFLQIVNKVKKKKKIMTPITQIIYDPKTVLMKISQKLRKRYEIYEKFADLVFKNK